MGRLLKLLGGNTFNPLDLGPALWLDASDGSTLYQQRSSPTTLAASDSDAVGTWRDKSGNARHFASSSDAKRPTRKLATHAGKSSILFDGVDDTFSVTSSILGGVSGWTIYMARQWQSLSATGCGFAGGNNIIEYVVVSGGLVTERRSYVSSGIYGSTSTLSLTSDIVSLTFDGSKSTNATRLVRRTNGTQDTLTFAGTVPATSESHTSLVVGGLTNSSNFFKGSILEIIVLLSAATATTTQNVERYLGLKWGISVA
jgi:hypothetical protein